MRQIPNLFVANWKMNMSLDAAHSFVSHHRGPLHQLASDNKKTIVLCPSFVALSKVYEAIGNTGITMGAQNCSEYEAGAYTGEVDAQSLAQVGCSYCIVGHSERRMYFGDTDEMVAKKVGQLLIHAIRPIICIGETKEQHEKRETFELLTIQLKPIISMLIQHQKQIIDQHMDITIAYEPVWSIGSGIIPELEYLEKLFLWIAAECRLAVPALMGHIRFIYGGSVTMDNAQKIMAISCVNGLLIGGASLDFQKFQNIVSLKT